MTDKKKINYISLAEISVLEAMKKIDDSNHKILFVTDKEKKLVGSLSDGDVRRWILSGEDLSEKVINVCNRNPIYVNIDYNKEDLKEIMLKYNIKSIPVLTKNKSIDKVIRWQDVFSSEKTNTLNKKLNCSVVIMAGGFGKRLAPFTSILPKPLIPVEGKTIVEHIISKFLDYNVKEFFMTINHKSNIIESYFNDVDKNYEINFYKEQKPLGTAGGLKLLENDISKNFILSNCDIIIHSDYSKILNHHINNKFDITLVSSMTNYKIPYGVCEINKIGQLVKIKEKPEYNFLISTGMYIINKDVLKFIPEDKSFHITDLIECVKNNGGTIGVFPISEKSWEDVGDWDEYRKTLNKISIK